MCEKDVLYAAEQLKTLIGWQIVDTVITPNNDAYGFVVRRDPHGKPVERKVCWVDCDPEGNGPGWISIQGAPHE